MSSDIAKGFLSPSTPWGNDPIVGHLEQDQASAPWENDPIVGRISGPLDAKEGPIAEELGPIEGAYKGLQRGATQVATGVAGLARGIGDVQEVADRRLAETLGLNYELVVAMNPAMQARRLATEGARQFDESSKRLVESGDLRKSPSAAQEFAPGNWRWYTEGVTEFIPQLAVQTVIAIGTGGTSLLAQLAPFAISGGVMEGGNAYNEAKARLDQAGISEEDSTLAAAVEATLIGSINGAMEVLPGTIILRKNPAVKKVFNMALAKALARKAEKIAGGFVLEGGTEATQEAWGDTVQWMVENDPEAYGTWRRYAGVGVLGGVSGGGVAAVVPGGRPKLPAEIAARRDRLAHLKAIRQSPRSQLKRLAEEAGIPGGTRTEIVRTIQQEEEEIRHASTIRGPETQVREEPGRPDLRGEGEEQVSTEPAGEVAPAPEVPVEEAAGKTVLPGGITVQSPFAEAPAYSGKPATGDDVRTIFSDLTKDVPGIVLVENADGVTGALKRDDGVVELRFDPDYLAGKKADPDWVKAGAEEELIHAQHHLDGTLTNDTQEAKTRLNAIPDHIVTAAIDTHHSLRNGSAQQKLAEIERMREQVRRGGHITEWFNPKIRWAAERLEGLLKAEAKVSGESPPVSPQPPTEARKPSVAPKTPEAPKTPPAGQKGPAKPLNQQTVDEAIADAIATGKSLLDVTKAALADDSIDPAWIKEFRTKWLEIPKRQRTPTPDVSFQPDTEEGGEGRRVATIEGQEAGYTLTSPEKTPRGFGHLEGPARRLHSISLEEEFLGKRVGQKLFMDAMAGGEWLHSSQLDAPAVRALEAMQRHGTAEVWWRNDAGEVTDGPLPKTRDIRNWMARLTDKGRAAAAELDRTEETAPEPPTEAQKPPVAPETPMVPKTPPAAPREPGVKTQPGVAPAKLSWKSPRDARYREVVVEKPKVEVIAHIESEIEDLQKQHGKAEGLDRGLISQELKAERDNLRRTKAGPDLVRVRMYETVVEAEPDVVPGEATKQPWEMTALELSLAEDPEGHKLIRSGVDSETAMRTRAFEIEAREHRQIVEQAHSEGKPVPPNVLAEYPDLQPKIGRKGVTKKPAPPASPATTETQPEAQEGAVPAKPLGMTEDEFAKATKRVKVLKRYGVGGGRRFAAVEVDGKRMDVVVRESLGDSEETRIPEIRRLAYRKLQAESQPPSKPKGAPAAEPTPAQAARADVGASLRKVMGTLNDMGPLKAVQNPKQVRDAKARLGGEIAELVGNAIKAGYHSAKEYLVDVANQFGQAAADKVAPLVEREWKKQTEPPERTTGTKPAKIDNLIDDWLADRQDAEQDADSMAARHQDELRQIIGKRSARETVGEAFKGNPRQRERAADAAMHMYIDLKDAEKQGFGTPAEQMAKYGGKLSDVQKNLFASSQSLPPAVQALADKIIEENKAQGEEALEAEVLKNVRDNYSARLWKQEPGEIPADAVGKFRTTTARARARTLESILHGWSLGKELQINGAIGAQQIAAKQVSQAIHDRRMIKAAVSEGLLSNKKEESDWQIVEHPNFKNWQWIGKAEEGKVYGRGTFITNDGDILQEVPLYAPKDTAKALNNILGESKLPGGGLFTKWNAIFKHLLLSLSLFHHQAFLRSYIFGTHGIEGFRPLKAYRDGRRAILNYEGMTRELVRGGLTIGTVQDFDERLVKEKTAIGKVIDKVPVAAEVKNALIALRDQQIDFLFRKLGARLKVMGALHEFQRLLTRDKKKLESGEVTREELARIAAEMLNDDFGGLNLQRMRRNPTAQHIFRLLALAPDWTESNVRTMAKAIKSGQEAAAYRRMWSRVILRAGGATVLFQLLMAGMDDEEDFWSMYQRQWKEGNLRWLDVDVTPLAKWAGFKIGRGQRKYFSVLGHFRDPVKFIVHPVKSAKHKSSVLGSFVLEALTGTDWAGRGFTTFAELLGIDDKGTYKTSGKRSDGTTYEEGDPKGGQLAGQTVSWGNRGALEYSQLPSFMLAQGKGVLPIQTQNLIGFLAGEMDGFDAVTKSVGLMTATTYPDKEKENEYGNEEWWKSGNAEERNELFERDLERMSWRGEPLGYHESLTPGQMKQVKERHEEKKRDVVYAAFYSPEEARRKAKKKGNRAYKSDKTFEQAVKERDDALASFKEMGVSHDEAQELLLKHFWQTKKGERGSEYDQSKKGRVQKDSYRGRGIALAELYGKDFKTWREAWLPGRAKKWAALPD